MIKVLPFKQTKGYCGPTSLRIVLSHFDVNISEKALARLCRASRDDGCTDRNIIRAAKKLGFKGKAKRHSTLNDIKNLINKDIPLIVDWFSEKTGGHYSVIVGMDKDLIIMADPHYGKIMNYRKDWFKDRWFDVVDDKLILRELIVIERR